MSARDDTSRASGIPPSPLRQNEDAGCHEGNPEHSSRQQPDAESPQERSREDARDHPRPNALPPQAQEEDPEEVRSPIPTTGTTLPPLGMDRAR